MATISIRGRTPEDDERILDILNRIQPDFPPLTLEEHRYEMDHLPKTAHYEIVVAEEDGEIVGTGTLLTQFWAAEKDRYIIPVGVDPNRWGNGIGSQLYEYLYRRALELGAVRLSGSVSEAIPEGKRFATKRGFAPTGRVHRMSRLDVRTANLEGYEGIEERLQSEGLRIASLAEVGADDDDFLHRLYRLTTETWKDVPSSFEFAEPPFEEWYDRDLGFPGISPHSVFVAMDDEQPVGIAIVSRHAGNAAGNWYTGVHRDHRGRGIARGLKMRTIEWARESGVERIFTGNDIDNKRMLAINIRLGYEPVPAFVEMVKDLNGS
jgi:mycothiol synthase